MKQPHLSKIKSESRWLRIKRLFQVREICAVAILFEQLFLASPRSVGDPLTGILVDLTAKEILVHLFNFTSELNW